MSFFLETPTTSQRETVTPPAPQILEDDELIAGLLNTFRQGVAAGAAKANTSSPGAKANTSAGAAKANTSSPGAKANTSSPSSKVSTEEDTICRRRLNASTPAAQLPTEDCTTKMPFLLETPTTSQRETVTPPAPQILEYDELVARLLGIYHRGVAAGAANSNTLSPGAKANTSSPNAKANGSSPDAKANTSSPGLISRCQGQHLISRYQDQHRISTADRGPTSGGPSDADPGNATTTTRATTSIWRHPQRGPGCLPGPARSPHQGTHHSHPRGRGRPSTPVPHRRSYEVVPTTRRQLHEHGRVLPAVQSGIPQLQAQTEPL
ncbi:hypothetical protein QE152_g26291 [Popillia japonica]|uniref:Uncharacterized protein n=1 Tax=Popillia japonica TaxID=7064 RepID=A0AAW1JXL3_POPJA